MTKLRLSSEGVFTHTERKVVLSRYYAIPNSHLKKWQTWNCKRWHKKYRSIIFILILILVFNATLYKAEAMDKVILQLRWDHQFQFAGYYAALWQGYYDDEDLKVEIRSAFTEDGQILQATDEVAEGRADFGVGAVDILIKNDEEFNLAIIASIFQRSAVEFFMKEETHFNSIVDLVNLKTARRENDLLDIELQAMLIAEGLNPNQLELYKHNGNFTIDDLITKRFDVVPVYLSSILYYSQREDIELKSIKPIDYGIDFYGDSLFTTVALARENPELVERFKRATLRGWEYALENTEQMAEKIATSFISTEENVEEIIDRNRFQAEKILDLTFYPVIQIGNINPHRWKTTHEYLHKLGIVSGDIILDQLIFDYEAILMQETKRQEKIMRTLSFSSLMVLVAILLIHLTAKNTMNQLENLFQNEMEENKKKEGIIIYQARMAAMGEMIANIAHQWRQPLNNLGLILTNIEDEFMYEELSKESLEDAIERSRRLINKMSETIDDFRYLSNPKESKAEFCIYDSIVSVIELLEEKLRLSNIKVFFGYITMDKGYGYNNQYSQAIFNIIVNSIDALLNTDVENRQILINIYKKEDMIITEIQDSGGGISEDIKDKIFDVYFTTKDKSQGTGLGLYMTKIIIKNNLNGNISWENTDKGVKMIVAVPCKGVDKNDEGRTE